MPRGLSGCRELCLALKVTLMQLGLPVLWGHTEAAQRLILGAGLEPEASAAFQKVQLITWGWGPAAGGGYLQKIVAESLWKALQMACFVRVFLSC